MVLGQTSTSLAFWTDLNDHGYRKKGTEKDIVHDGSSVGTRYRIVDRLSTASLMLEDI